jgi:hypothetical protein
VKIVYLPAKISRRLLPSSISDIGKMISISRSLSLNSESQVVGTAVDKVMWEKFFWVADL